MNVVVEYDGWTLRCPECGTRHEVEHDNIKYNDSLRLLRDFTRPPGYFYYENEKWRCVYCGYAWDDAAEDSERHRDDCPIVRARELLASIG